MVEPVFASVINTSNVPQTLQDGHNDSVTVVPYHTPVLVSYKFVTWGMLPRGIKILNYVMADGSRVDKPPVDDRFAVPGSE